MAISALILAAGRGSRLHPVTASAPKCLTELDGVTLLERQVGILKSAGIDDVVVVTGYLSEMLILPGTRQAHNARWESTNMVESLFCAEAEFGDDLIVAYSDIAYEPRVLDALLHSRRDIAVAVDLDWRAYWEQRFDDPLSDAESLRLDGEGRITEIGNAVTDIAEIEAQYIGLMRFRGGGVETLRMARAGLGRVTRPWMRERAVENAYMTDLLMEMILTGTPVHAVPVEGGWLEIDNHRDLKIARAMVSDGIIDRSRAPKRDTSTA